MEYYLHHFYLFKWNKNKKEQLETPKKITTQIHPYQLVGNITMIAAISGIIGAKIFHNLENFDLFLKDPVGQLISFSGLTFTEVLLVVQWVFCGILKNITYVH